MRVGPYKDIGLQLRSVRERLKLTLDDLHGEIGISRSYISNFERGLKLPTVKYLKHLHDKYGVSLDYIFCSNGRMFRGGGEATAMVDFGKSQEDVDGMFRLMARVPHALHSMLVAFAEYKLEHEDFLKRFEARLEHENEEGS
jgi:transcriptional regulator with XRE-family HTH domain